MMHTITTIVLWVLFGAFALTALASNFDTLRDVTGPRRAVTPLVLACVIGVIIAARSIQ